LVLRRGQVLVSDMRYAVQLEGECPGLDLHIRSPGVPLLDSVAKVIGKAKIRKLAIEAASLTVAGHEQLRGKLRSVELIPAADLVEQLRVIKDRDEINLLRNAVREAEKAFAVVRAALRLEQTEREVAHQLEHQIRLFGSEGCSFPPIVAVGPRAALPHATPTACSMGEGDFVLIDWGARKRRYRSDLTRILVTGRISPKLKRVYEVVLKAQRRAIAAIRPGAVMSDIDLVARRVISDAGYGKRFGQGLGHGMGLDIHEAPRLAVRQKQPLEAGMVVTVEPGIYLRGWGGVRIEDDVLVTKTGHEVLSSVSKELGECVVA
jgi:Xaa-Pro aminopeptidase